MGGFTTMFGIEPMADLNKIKDFISQVEKDAIEKTNKRWRDKVEKAFKLGYENGQASASPTFITMDIAEQQAKDSKLSDLLEDKK